MWFDEIISNVLFRHSSSRLWTLFRPFQLLPLWFSQVKKCILRRRRHFPVAVDAGKYYFCLKQNTEFAGVLCWIWVLTSIYVYQLDISFRQECVTDGPYHIGTDHQWRKLDKNGLINKYRKMFQLRSKFKWKQKLLNCDHIDVFKQVG